jgi:hypothetical protein
MDKNKKVTYADKDFGVNGLITSLSISNARFANCLPRNPYCFNISRVSGKIE